MLPHELENTVPPATIVEQVDKKKQNHPAVVAATPLSAVSITTTVSNATNATTVASSTGAVTVPTESNKKAALQLVSQLEQNILIKQAASSAAQEVITSDVLTTTESSVSRDSSSVAHVSRSISPAPPNKQVYTYITSNERSFIPISAKAILFRKCNWTAAIIII